MLQTMYRMRDRMRSKKGFTLMEMLIVVAIIAILIAIAIPVFSSQLTKAKIATDHANMRSAYALMQAAILTDAIDGTPLQSGEYYMQKDGTLSNTAKNYYILQATEATSTFGVATIADGTHKQGNVIKVTFTAATDTSDAKATLTLAAKPA